MMTSSNGNIFCITGPFWREFTGHWWIPVAKPVTLSFYDLFDLGLNKHLSKQVRCQWFEMPSCLLSCHCNDIERKLWKKLNVGCWTHITQYYNVSDSVESCYNLSMLYHSESPDKNDFSIIISREKSPQKCYIHDLAQDCSSSSALAMELLQSCTKPSIYH